MCVYIHLMRCALFLLRSETFKIRLFIVEDMINREFFPSQYAQRLIKLENKF